jgi:hypothetical protein
MKNLINELRLKAEESNSVAMDNLLNTAANVIESQDGALDAAYITIDKYGASLDEMFQILQQIWVQDGFVDEDLKGAIRKVIE